MKIGFIGCGNMARAMIDGILRTGFAAPESIWVSSRDPEKLAGFAEPRKLRVAPENSVTAREADILVLAVKPDRYESVLTEIAPALREQTVVVSIAPGKTLEQLERLVGRPAKIVRAMPNTPAAVGEGMTAICCGPQVTGSEAEAVILLLSSFGRAAIVSERQMDAVVAVSGSSPAYVFVLIEVMGDAAVHLGMPRAQAYEFAAQAVLGAARMVRDLGIHPGALKDQVCSPGGTTIEALRRLESGGFRSAVIEAMIACAEKSARM